MENSDDEYVYHGSEKEFDSDHAVPKRQVRQKINKEGKMEVIFDEESFHATPYKWIALAYTYSSVPYEIEGKTAHYNIGVSLYDNNHTVTVLGFGSLEKSLKKLYGDGGYVYHFDKNKFIFKEGLGNLEVVINEPTKPVAIERVNDPVNEMKELGATFNFVDLALPENENQRNYY
jgi:hypothetical protein